MVLVNVFLFRVYLLTPFFYIGTNWLIGLSCSSPLVGEQVVVATEADNIVIQVCIGLTILTFTIHIMFRLIGSVF